MERRNPSLLKIQNVDKSFIIFIIIFIFLIQIIYIHFASENNNIVSYSYVDYIVIILYVVEYLLEITSIIFIFISMKYVKKRTFHFNLKCACYSIGCSVLVVCVGEIISSTNDISNNKFPPTVVLKYIYGLRDIAGFQFCYNHITLFLERCLATIWVKHYETIRNKKLWLLFITFTVSLKRSKTYLMKCFSGPVPVRHI